MLVPFYLTFGFASICACFFTFYLTFVADACLPLWGKRASKQEIERVR
jgi:hypothetical protein